MFYMHQANTAENHDLKPKKVGFFKWVFGRQRSSSVKSKTKFQRVDREIRDASITNNVQHLRFGKEIEPMLKELEMDNDLDSENELVLKILIKAYTSEVLFKKVNDCLSKSQFAQI